MHVKETKYVGERRIAQSFYMFYAYCMPLISYLFIDV